ncbi:MAG: hypothetical protein KAW89_11050 [Armatimonadetes bacterium]|nr:hypothetical protein [Armatimonadota bacterium]
MSQANASGTGAAVPAEVRGWNWGAFWLTWVWVVGNRLWKVLLIAGVCLLGYALLWYGPGGTYVMPFDFLFLLAALARDAMTGELRLEHEASGDIAFVASGVACWLVWRMTLGWLGNIWAWRYGKFDNVQEFRRPQRIWAWVGWAWAVCSAFLIAWPCLPIPELPCTDRPGALGTLEQVKDPPPEWRPEYRRPEPKPAPELKQQVDALVRPKAGLHSYFSPDGEHALLYRRPDLQAAEVKLWLVNGSVEKQFTVQLPGPGDFLKVQWSPDNRYVIVWRVLDGPDTPVKCTFARLALSEEASAQVQILSGPPVDYYWELGSFSADASVLFATNRQSVPPYYWPGHRGELWAVAMADGKRSLLNTQPPPRWPPSIRRRTLYGLNPLGEEPAYYAGFSWPSRRRWKSSPSGDLLVFVSYAPDNYLSRALWVANLRTRQVRQVTWERSEDYAHWPIRWQDDDWSFVFGRSCDSGAVQYFVLTLASDIWDEGGAGESQ